MFRNFPRLLVIAIMGIAACSLHATTIVPPSFSAMVNGSDCIVRAVVTKVQILKVERPQGPRIFTEVELRVTEVVAGSAPSVLTLRFLGGKLGNEELNVHGSPRFRPGDEDFLFVSGNGSSFCPLYAMGYGRYPVRLDPTTGISRVCRADGTPLVSLADISRPLEDHTAAATPTAVATASEALSPTDFIQHIRAARSSPSQTSHEH